MISIPKVPQSIACILGFLFITTYTFAQPPSLQSKIDSLISATTQKPFNGIIMVSENGKSQYAICFGFSDIYKMTGLKHNDQFVIGSISKQITAVLVLQEYEKGNLQLHIPIKRYLPEFTQAWTDSVTIHQLLTHTHGIPEDLSSTLQFKPGTQFSYSQIGYDLLSKIIERSSGKPFSELSRKLFESCKMKNTFHPALNKHRDLVKGYNEQANGSLCLVSETEVFNNTPIAAGGFISTAPDMLKWNACLHNGKLLKDSTYRIMTTKHKGAIRQHPIFGPTEYGYGITIKDQNDILQVGQTGFAPGFVSMNFYFPATKTSIVMLENIAYDLSDIKKVFHYHVQVLDIIRESYIKEGHKNGQR